MLKNRRKKKKDSTCKTRSLRYTFRMYYGYSNLKTPDYTK